MSDNRYRIKIEKFKNKIDHTPQVKLTLGGKWLNLVKRDNGITPEDSIRYIYKTKIEASDIIQEYKQQIIQEADENTILDTSYDYDVEETNG